MPRIRLHEQPHYEFTYQTLVQARDITYTDRHLAHYAVVQIAREARVDMLRALGLRELDLGDGKTGVITRDVAVNFKGEAFLFDTLCVESCVEEISQDSLRVFHRITRAGELIALAEAGLIGFDYGSRAIAPIPDAFNRALALWQGLQETFRNRA